MSRLGAVIAVALGWSSFGCSGGDPESTAPLDVAPSATPATDAPIGGITGATAEEPEAVVPGSDAEWGLDFAIAGRSVPMTARAELQVFEGVPVHVAIIGRTSGTDLMMLDLSFDGLQAALGSHRVAFSLPEGGAHVANGNLDGTWYYSQGGEATVNVNPDGPIEGTFDIALARGEMGGIDDPVVFEPDVVAMPLVGHFSGQWVLDCHSRLAGHQSFITGGDFCERLDF